MKKVDKVEIDFSKINLAEAYRLIDNYDESYNLFSIRHELGLNFIQFRQIIYNNLDKIQNN